MKVLIISGICPDKNNSLAGAFIRKRVEFLEKITECKLYKIGNEYNYFYRYINEKILNRNINDDDIEIVVENVKWNNINIKKGLINILLNRINEKIYYKYNIKKIANELNVKEYDIIHAHWAYPTGYIAMLLSKKFNIPYIVTAHGSDIHTIPNESDELRKNTLEVLENATRVIFVSEALKQQANNIGYQKENYNIIYNGIDLNKFYSSYQEKDNKENNKKVVGYIGRLELVKGADRLPQIFYEVKRMNCNTEFLVIGDGSLKKDIITKLDKMNIEYSYYPNMPQEKLRKFMNKCDVIIVPSRNESFCLVALEAQACGVKVVASKVGGIPEAVGEYGFLVNEQNDFEKIFAQQVNWALENTIDDEKMINRAKEFSWEKTVMEEYNLYNKIIKEYRLK